MKAPKVITADFETEAIGERPDYPPVPVGLSIKYPQNSKPRYLAWGHPTGNNCTKEDAISELKAAKKLGLPILFHNGKFDIDVAEEHMDFGEWDWDDIHDTMYLVFLNDPHAISLGLKETAEKLLGIAPEEQNELKDWILGNIKGARPSNWGEFICLAPGELVGKYANGDTNRTEKIFKHLYPKVAKAGMLEAYERERKLMPIFLESERQGLRVDLKLLKKDIELYTEECNRVEAWLRRRLKSKELDFNKKEDVAKALDKSGVVTDWVLTKTGKKSTAKENMTVDVFNDTKVFLALGYRSRLTTLLGTFMEPWLQKGTSNNGYIHPNWNQVRQPKGEDDNKGTRTGRPSCSNPNLLNVAKSFEDRGDGYTHPKFIKDLAPLPLIRKYLLPDKGCVWLHRDYSQQELRILAHFEDGTLMKEYKDNPRMDVHQFIKDTIKQVLHKDFDRTTVKTTVFGRIYGQGLGSLAKKLGAAVEEVKEVRDAQNKALPGLPQLDKDIKNLGKEGEPIITWGGRVYYVEEPKYVERFGREMTFEYKLLNYLIQGSAADATKEAIIRFYYDKKRRPEWRFLVTVYDEINICAPTKDKEEAMEFLREHMEGIELDVPLLTDGKAGKSWGTLKGVK